MLRNSNLNTTDFIDQLETIVQSTLSQRSLNLRKNVSMNPNFFAENFDFSFNGLPHSLDDMIAVSIASWYFPEIIRLPLQLEIHQWVNKFSLEDNWIFSILLSNKATCLIYLIETNRWHTRNFFQKILSKQTLTRAFRQLRWRKIDKRKPKVLARKRGHTDGFSPIRAPGGDEYKDDWTSARDHRVLLEKRELIRQFTLAYEGWLS